MVEGGFDVKLQVTLSMPGTFCALSPPNCSRISVGSRVGVVSRQ